MFAHDPTQRVSGAACLRNVYTQESSGAAQLRLSLRCAMPFHRQSSHAAHSFNIVVIVCEVVIIAI